ncbi:MAG: alpha-ketoglutarate-dependent dioxygenase AlkB [Acidimicrobiia bacterium]
MSAVPAPRLDPTAPAERLWLDDTSWVDVVRGWLHDDGEVLATVIGDAAWRQGRVWRYERWVDEPRLGTSWAPGAPPPHPLLVDAHRDVRRRYKPFGGFALALYRDGRDGVAFHRDRELRWLDDTVIGVLTLGATRPWRLRPRANRHALDELHGATHDLRPAAGDLLVMGGRCQADWEHAVPKVPGPVGPRVSLQWRWSARSGRPEQGASYRAPRNYSRSG